MAESWAREQLCFFQRFFFTIKLSVGDSQNCGVLGRNNKTELRERDAALRDAVAKCSDKRPMLQNLFLASFLLRKKSSVVWWRSEFYSLYSIVMQEYLRPVYDYLSHCVKGRVLATIFWPTEAQYRTQPSTLIMATCTSKSSKPSFDINFPTSISIYI